MKYVLLVMLVIAPLAASAGPCWWVTPHGGEYKGTDLVDGGSSHRTFIEEDGQCLMRGGDTWHGPCGYGYPAVLTSELAFNNGGLEGNWDLDCQAPPTDVSGDRFLFVRYTRNVGTGALTEQLLDTAGNELSRPPIVFYRVSK